MFSGATAIGTYLINIVKNLGGNTSLYGVAMFAMAFSELPVMMTVPKLMKKFNSVTLILVASIFYLCRNYTIGLAPNLIVLIIGHDVPRSFLWIIYRSYYILCNL